MSDYAQEVPDVDNDEVPDVADDNSPERARVPEPDEPALPADRPLGAEAPGTTVAEQLDGESLDDKLAREQE